MNEIEFINWLASFNYELMMLCDSYWWPSWGAIFLFGGMFGMTPLKMHHEQLFNEVVLVKIRYLIIIYSIILIILPILTSFIYDATMDGDNLESNQEYFNWFYDMALREWHYPFIGIAIGLTIRLITKRYLFTFISSLMRKFRNKQTDDELSDIRDESANYLAKDYNPSSNYKLDSIFIGLDENDKPIQIPLETWYEVNMQVIGPTRYGKGVILGCIMEQVIKMNDGLIYIDPKDDKFAPHIMKQACDAVGRPFYYITLHDDGIGKWAPFLGGSERDALARIEYAYGLEMTGDPGTDYFKTQEKSALVNAFSQSRHIDKLYNLLADSEANRINAELESWSKIKSLCPKKGTGFSIEKALKENAVVYVNGSLTDNVIKSATKVFIIEVIQEAMRLKKVRKNHLTFIIDEVRFLVSNKLADALSTVVGANVNIVLAYQSIGDLLNPDDKTINGRSLLQSINVNSQVKAIYGGADYETADWTQKTSGTVLKEVTKFEKTNVSLTGGETWENSRMVGMQEENHLHANKILTLPPRVCAFFQPGEIATICFTSFVKVKDNSILEKYLESKANKVDVLHAKQDQEKTSRKEKQKKNKVKNKEEIKTKIQPPKPNVLHAKGQIDNQTSSIFGDR
ncbi:MAG: TraM recognition domain-containing protein, partial [Methylococcales bacterium]